MRTPSTFHFAAVAVASFAVAIGLFGLDLAGVDTLSFGGASVPTGVVVAAAMAVGLGCNAANEFRSGDRRSTLFWSLWTVGIPLSVADVPPSWLSWIGVAAGVASVLVSWEADRRVWDLRAG